MTTLGNWEERLAKSKRKGYFLPHQLKSTATKLLGQVEKSYQARDRRCWFVVNENGRRCKDIAINSHILSKRAVLDLLKDASGKVLELRWEPKNWKHLFMQSSPDNAVDLSNAGHFEPQLIGIDNACSGPLACLNHDQQFSKIDRPALEFCDPDVVFLTAYRAVLYDASLISHGESLLHFWKQSPSSHRSSAVRNNWITNKRRFENVKSRTGRLATKLGKYWYERRNHNSVKTPVAGVTNMNFRSSLRFSASLTFRDEGVVSVFPSEGHVHKLVSVFWSRDTTQLSDITKQLQDRATITMTEQTNALEFLETLISASSGVAAISPESYQGLDYQEQIKINELLMQSVQPWRLDMILSRR